MRSRWIFAFFLACQPSPPAPTPPGTPRALAAGGKEWRVDRTQLLTFVTQASPTPRVFNFWATWCGPCRQEMPMLKDFAAAHPGHELWLVNTDHPDAPAARVDRMVEELGLEGMRHLRPAAGEGEVTAALPDFPDVLPVTIVVGRTGAPFKTWLGVVSEDELNQVVATAP